MSNELAQTHLLSKNVYAIVRLRSNAYIWDVGDEALEAIGTWNNARVGECDIVLPDKGGGLYAANFPAACTIAGTYLITYFERAGASPVITDRLIGRSTIKWNGSYEINELAMKTLTNKAIQNKSTGVIVYYDDDGVTPILVHTPTDGESEIIRTPS